MLVTVSVRVSEGMRRRIEGAVAAAGGRVQFVAHVNEIREESVIHFGDATLDFVYRQPRLRWIHTASAGVDRLTLGDRPFPKHVLLTNSSGVYGVAGAEHVLGMMLHFARGFHFYLKQQRLGAWVRDLTPARRLQGSTVVVLGLGDLGRNVVARAKAFGVRVIGVRRQPGAVPGADRVVTVDELDAVLPLADHLVITLPLTAQTRRLLDRRRLFLLPKGAYVYNIGRGAVIDQDALVEALQAGHLAGAGLDVFEQEPLPPESPLWRMENVIITPHIGADTPWDADAAAELFLDNLQRFLDGKPLRNVVDPDLGY